MCKLKICIDRATGRLLKQHVPHARGPHPRDPVGKICPPLSHLQPVAATSRGTWLEPHRSSSLKMYAAESLCIYHESSGLVLSYFSFKRRDFRLLDEMQTVCLREVQLTSRLEQEAMRRSASLPGYQIGPERLGMIDTISLVIPANFAPSLGA